MKQRATEQLYSRIRVRIHSIGEAFPSWILDHRFFILGVLGLLVAASVYGMLHLRADFSFEMIFLSEDEEVAFFEAFKQRFEESSRDIVVLIKGHNVFSREGLIRVQKLTSDLEKIEGIEKVTTILNAPFIRPVEGGVAIEPLAVDIPEEDEEIEVLKQRALQSRLFKRMLISEDGTTLAFLARLAPNIQTEKEKRPVIDAVRQAAFRLMSDRYEVYFSGIPTIQKAYTDQGLRDLKVFLLLSVAVVCFFLFVTFRNLQGLYLPQVVVITSVILILGLMALCRQKINLINNVIPSLLLVYGISDSIHLIHRYHEEVQRGHSKRDALLVTLRRMAVACFMTSFTTAVGFLSLVTATIHIIKTFGLFAGLGIMGAYAVTIVLLPILLYLHPKVQIARTSYHKDGLIERLLLAIGSANEKVPRLILGSGLVVLGVSLYFCTQVNIESYILEELTEKNPIVRANHIVERDMMGVFPYEVEVVAGGEGDGLEPAFLTRVDQLQSFIASKPWIRKTFSVVDLLKEMHQAMHGGDPTYFRVPETRELVAQYLLLYEMSGNVEQLDVLITSDHSSLRLACQGIDMGTKNFFALKQETEKKASELFAPPQGIHVTGRSLLAQRALNNVIRDMLWSIFSAFGIIFVAVAVLYRSFKIGLIAMLPNVIPLVCTMGLIGVVGMNLRTSTVITFAIALGIAVDDTIHYVTRFREEVWASGDYVASMYRTLRSAGRAIVVTTLIMIAGFLVITVSEFKATRDFGFLASVTLATALIGSLMFLPSAINVFKPWKVDPRVTSTPDT